MKNIPFKHPWVFVIDADERMTPDLIRAVNEAVMSPDEHVVFHVQTSPFYMRLFMHDKMRYERLINPVSIADGPVGQVSGFLAHFPFSKGIGHWVDRHNSYSRFEVQQIVENRKAQAEFSLIKVFTDLKITDQI